MISSDDVIRVYKEYLHRDPTDEEIAYQTSKDIDVKIFEEDIASSKEAAYVASCGSIGVAMPIRTPEETSATETVDRGKIPG